MTTNRLKAFLRSVFPFLESGAIAVVTHYTAHLSPTTSAYILGGGGVLLSAVLHWLEGHFPWVGVFLGWIGAPTYAPSAKQTLKGQVAQLQDQLSATQVELNAWKTARPASGTATITADGASSVA